MSPLQSSPARTASALVIDDEAPARDELSYLLRTTFSIAPESTPAWIVASLMLAGTWNAT